MLVKRNRQVKLCPLGTRGPIVLRELENWPIVVSTESSHARRVFYYSDPLPSSYSQEKARKTPIFRGQGCRCKLVVANDEK